MFYHLQRIPPRSAFLNLHTSRLTSNADEIMLIFCQKLLCASVQVQSALMNKITTRTSDVEVIQDLKTSLEPSRSLTWTDLDPCKWIHVGCSKDKRVTSIQISNLDLRGSLPSSLAKLTELQRFEVMHNELTGPLPSLAGLSSLQSILVNGNNFSSIPSDFFSGMSSLQFVNLDYNPFSVWQIPETLKVSSLLKHFSAISTNITENISNVFGGNVFPGLTDLLLAFNSLSSELPRSFSYSSIQCL